MNFTINVNITGLEGVVSVLERLVGLSPSTPASEANPAMAQAELLWQLAQKPSSAMTAPVMTSATAPALAVVPAAPQPVLAYSAQPVGPAPVAPVAEPVPVAAPPVYTEQQLAVAATQLVDAGRMEEVRGLLSMFGVQALTHLPKEQYGNFATQLRAMGAKI